MKFLIKFIALVLLENTFASFDVGKEVHLPSNCNDPSITRDGEYLIYPYGSNPVLVYCEVSRGGWTRILNKVDRTPAFGRGKVEYVEGFGETFGNYWLGLDNIRGLVEQEPYSVRIELSNGNLESYFAEYDFFYVHSSSKNYRLKLGRYTSGNLIDTFRRMSGNDFSFNDTACGIQYSAGWWFDSGATCHSVCLTCERNFAGTEGHWLNYNWLIFANVKMMIRPLEPFRPSSCYDIYKSADGLVKRDGLYNIYLTNSLNPVRVYCEMSRGGWTRILNKVDRVNGSFDKSWADYAEGFGPLDGNSWLGLRNIQSLTNSQQNRLRIELSNDQTDRDFIEYDSFLVGSEKEDFKLEIGQKGMYICLYMN